MAPYQLLDVTAVADAAMTFEANNSSTLLSGGDTRYAHRNQ